MSKYCSTCSRKSDCHIFEYACKSGVLDKNSMDWGCILHKETAMVPLDEVIILLDDALTFKPDYLNLKRDIEVIQSVLKQKYGAKDAKD